MKGISSSHNQSNKIHFVVVFCLQSRIRKFFFQASLDTLVNWEIVVRGLIDLITSKIMPKWESPGTHFVVTKLTRYKTHTLQNISMECPGHIE